MNQINQAFPRLEKAYEILDKITITSESKSMYVDDKKIYHIDYVEEICECPDHVYRQLKCKHVWASQIKLKKVVEQL